jgi:hypothetical protein
MDLNRAFFPVQNTAEIKRIGHRILEAYIPEPGGLNGVFVRYHAVVKTMPAFGSRLSELWDGIGGWAD